MLFMLILKYISLLNKSSVGPKQVSMIKNSSPDISISNNDVSQFEIKLDFLLKFCKSNYQPFFNDKRKLIILYHINQIVYPILKLKSFLEFEQFKQLHPFIIEEYITFFIGGVKRFIPSILQTWRQFVLLNFIMMEMIISRKLQKNINIKLDNEEIIDPNLLKHDYLYKFAPYIIVNLNSFQKPISKLGKEIYDHKAYAFFTNFLLEYTKNHTKLFLNDLLEDFLALPFDEKNIIKSYLCNILFINGDYLKSYQLLQQLLEREKNNYINLYGLMHLGALLCNKYLDKQEVFHGFLLVINCVS